MQELTDWIERNKWRTWNWENKMAGKDLTLEIKYLEFSLDTRDLTVWSVSASGLGGGDTVVSIRDTSDTGRITILDELESKLNKARMAHEVSDG